MLKKLLITAMAAYLTSGAASAVEVTMYYPVSAGGPIAQAYERLAADFTKANPSITIKPVFAGNQVDG